MSGGFDCARAGSQKPPAVKTITSAMQISAGFIANSSQPRGPSWPLSGAAVTSSRHARLHRILDLLDLVKLDVAQFAVDLFDAADIDILDDVACLRVDGDGPARTLPRQALRRADQTLAVGLAAGFLQRLVDQVHPVPAPDREHVRVTTACKLAIGADKFLVQSRAMVPIIMGDGDEPERHVAHAFERGIIREVAIAQH